MSDRTTLARRLVGGLYLCCAGLNAGLVLADPEVYREFAASSYLPFVRTGWDQVVMAHPSTWILLLALGELAIGSSLLSSSPRAIRAGWAGVIGFHVLLMLFGFGFWLWAVPVLVVVVPLARRDVESSTRAALSPG
jgi:hypothetical protein